MMHHKLCGLLWRFKRVLYVGTAVDEFVDALLFSVFHMILNELLYE
jgi:hypothetical protein